MQFFSFFLTVVSEKMTKRFLKGGVIPAKLLPKKSCPTADTTPRPPRKESNTVVQPKKKQCYQSFAELRKRTVALKLKGWVFE